MEEEFERYFVDIHSAEGHVKLIARLARDGIATFDRVPTARQLLSLARSIGDILPHRDSDAVGVTTLAGTESTASARPGYLGLTSRELFPHTDGTGVVHPPTLVMLVCEQPAPRGGATTVVDARALYAWLSVHAPAVLHELRQPGSARFGGKPEYRGAVFEPVAEARRNEDARISIRFRWDELAAFTASTRAVMPVFLDLISRTGSQFTLRRGQGYIVQNGRWLHGRIEYAGDRKVHRILVRPRFHTPAHDVIRFGFAPPHGF